MERVSKLEKRSEILKLEVEKGE